MNSSTSVSIMDQYVDCSESSKDSAPCSGLAHLALSSIEAMDKEKSDAYSCVNLVVRPVTGLLLLRASDRAEELSNALQTRCGMRLSARLDSHADSACCVRWMSPDSWLLSCPLDEAFDIENTLREQVSGHLAIVNVSGGYSILELSGIHAREVLMKSTGYDTHPDHLPVGKVVNTTFAKTQVTLRCLELNENRGRYELIVRRSYSDYLWLWLQRAAAEYGLQATAAQ